jgi:predicted enzyme related to lactoylglutathione lyase
MKIDSVVFYSNDIEKVTNFYVNVLGFELDFIDSNRYVSFNFENVKLGIKLAKENREVPGSQTIFIEDNKIEDTYETFKDKGIKFYKELTDDPFAINFSVLDTDGNKIQYIKRK